VTPAPPARALATLRPLTDAADAPALTRLTAFTGRAPAGAA
jgi:hypothetical protein